MAGFKLTADRVRIEPDFFPDDRARKVAREEVDNTIANTLGKWAGGKNVHGQALKPGGYSESYKREIERGVRQITRGKRKGQLTTAKKTKGANKGRVRSLSKKGGNTIPNLRLSGDLAESFSGFDLAGGVGAEGRFEGGGRGRSISNADLLAHHRNKNGVVHPIGFGSDDTQRINERYSREIGDAFGKAIKVERGRS